MDNELSVRAGLNIGIEPTLLPFVQAGAGNLIPLSLSSDTIIAEHSENAARVFGNVAPFNIAAGVQGLQGYIYNTGAPLAGIGLFAFLFVDELGNEIIFGEGSGDVLTPGGPNPFGNGISPDAFFCLVPGEKIIARRVVTGP